MDALDSNATALPRLSLMVGQICRRNIRYFFMREGTECSRIASSHEFYLACMYDILRNAVSHREKMERLHFFKANMTRTRSVKEQSLATDTRENPLLPDERPMTFHLSRRQAKRSAQLITRPPDSSDVSTNKPHTCVSRRRF
jgi:hypothetical protein